MSWFKYGDIKKRSHAKGVALRFYFLPQALQSKIKNVIHQTDEVDFILVSELRPQNQVLLEVWVRSPGWGKFMRDKGMEKYTVLMFLADEDPEWICEGDVGRGWVKSK